MVDLVDPKSWQVAVKNEQGKVIAIMDRQEAIKQCKAQNNGNLHPDLIEKSCFKLDLRNVDLLRMNVGEMNSDDKLFLLKQVTGI